MGNKNITVIPARQSNIMQGLPGLINKRKVAGYARVSTDKDEQQNSYDAQVSYYTDYIKRNPEWEFVEVYTDEGITGTSTKHREGFKRMIADAKSTLSSQNRSAVSQEIRLIVLPPFVS